MRAPIRTRFHRGLRNPKKGHQSGHAQRVSVMGQFLLDLVPLVDIGSSLKNQNKV